MKKTYFDVEKRNNTIDIYFDDYIILENAEIEQAEDFQRIITYVINNLEVTDYDMFYTSIEHDINTFNACLHALEFKYKLKDKEQKNKFFTEL